jgi:hypothetical protein
VELRDTDGLSIFSAPAKPKAPLLEGVGKDGINVTFQEGAPEKGFPEKFIVVYRVKGT